MAADDTDTEYGTVGLIMSRGRYRKYRRRILQISSAEKKLRTDRNSSQLDLENTSISYKYKLNKYITIRKE